MKLRNVLLPLEISLGKFITNLKKLEEPFNDYLTNKKKIRRYLVNELDKSRICYSVGLKGESLFIIGRLFENQCNELLLKNKKNKDYRKINISKMNFEQKLNFLHFKLKYFTSNQFSKAIALKWDRNIFGHKITNTKNVKNVKANIMIGIDLIFCLESIILRFNNN